MNSNGRERFGGADGPAVEYTALPPEPAETVALTGVATDELSAAETGAFDTDD